MDNGTGLGYNINRSTRATVAWRKETELTKPSSANGSPPLSPGAKTRDGDRYRVLFERSPQPFLVVDPRTARIVEANAAAREFFADMAPSLIDAEIWRLTGWEPERARQVMMQAALGSGATIRVPNIPILGDRVLEIYAGPIEMAEGVLLYAIVHDITERVRVQDVNLRLRRLAATVSALNVTLRAAGDDESIFRETIGLLVSVGGAAAAFVGLAEPASRGLRIVAVDGDEKRLASGIQAIEGSLQPPSEIVSRTLETGRCVVGTGVTEEPSSDWLRATDRHGAKSQALIPIGTGDFTFGVIGILAEDADFFGDSEVELLEQMASMVATRMGEVERHEREAALAATIEAERRETERFAALSESMDRALERTARPGDLYVEACRLPVDHDICILAWFALVEAGARGSSLRISAAVGDTTYLDADLVPGRGRPSPFRGGSPIPMDRTVVIDDVLDDQRLQRRHQKLREAGLRSFVSVPVFIGPRLFGAMTFYSREVGAFGPREVALLDRLGVNVGHRLAVMESYRTGRQTKERAPGPVDLDTANEPAELGPKS